MAFQIFSRGTVDDNEYTGVLLLKAFSKYLNLNKLLKFLISLYSTFLFYTITFL